MELVKFSLGIVVVIFLYMGIMKIVMNIANYIGEQLRLTNFINKIIDKMKK